MKGAYATGVGVDFGDGFDGLGNSQAQPDWTSQQTSREWFPTYRAEYAPNWGEGHVEYVEEEFGTFINGRDETAGGQGGGQQRGISGNSRYGNAGMKGFWDDILDTVVGESEQQAVATVQTLISAGGGAVQDVITGTTYPAPSGQVAVGFNPYGQPLYIPQLPLGTSPKTPGEFMKKYGVYIYSTMGIAGALILLSILFPKKKRPQTVQVIQRQPLPPQFIERRSFS